jgi:hypothetical protein
VNECTLLLRRIFDSDMASSVNGPALCRCVACL